MRQNSEEKKHRPGSAGGGSLLRKASSYFNTADGDEATEAPAETKKNFMSSAFSFTAITEFKQILFDSQSITRSNSGYAEQISASQESNASVDSVGKGGDAGAVPAVSPATDVTFLEEAATAGTNVNKSLPQRPVDSMEVPRDHLTLFAFGESTRTPDSTKMLPHPPYKLHIVPRHKSDTTLDYVQLILSTICYWEQQVADPMTGGATVTRLRKVAVCLIVTCYEQRDYALFMTHINFLRGLLHRAITPSVLLLKQFFTGMARLATDRDRRNLLGRLQGDAATKAVATTMKDIFDAFLQSRLLVPALGVSPVCLPQVVKRMVRRAPSVLRATSTSNNKQVGAGTAAGVVHAAPLLSDDAVRDAVRELNMYNSDFLSKVIAGCIAVSNLDSFCSHGQMEAKRESGSKDVQIDQENIGRIVIASKDASIARNLMLVCAFFFKRDKYSLIEQTSGALLANEPLPKFGQASSHQGSTGSTYAAMTVPPVYGVYATSVITSAPILWYPHDDLQDVFSSLVDPHAVENTLLTIEPRMFDVKRYCIDRSFLTREGRFQCSIGSQHAVAVTPIAREAVQRALQTRCPDIPPLVAMQEEVAHIHQMARLYKMMLEKGLVASWPEVCARHGQGDATSQNALNSKRKDGSNHPQTNRSTEGSNSVLASNRSSNPDCDGTPRSLQSDDHSSASQQRFNPDEHHSRYAAFFAQNHQRGFNDQNVQLLWLMTLHPSTHIAS